MRRTSTPSSCSAASALLLGNSRFIGNAGWRQHEQSFDALSAVNNSIAGLSLTYAYLYRVNRVYGPDLPAPMGNADGIAPKL